MKIRNVAHKGLRRLIRDDDARALQPSQAAKLRRMVSFLQDMEHESELSSLPFWNPHMMGGDRKGTWSLIVTANWRLTFRIDRDDRQIVDLNFEDYH